MKLKIEESSEHKYIKKESTSQNDITYRVWYRPYSYPDEEDYIDITGRTEREARESASTLGYVTEVETIEGSIHEDVEIEVKNKGILEVPEDKNVDDLPMSHFEKLAKKKGLGKITKALNNLQVWNKKKDPKLSKWAGDMIDELNKKLKKESVSWGKKLAYSGNIYKGSKKVGEYSYTAGSGTYSIYFDNPKSHDMHWLSENEVLEFLDNSGYRFDKGELNKKVPGNGCTKKESVRRRRITESLDEYCVGVFKGTPGKDEYGDFETDFYDELFNFNNYQDAWEEALKWNLKGYFVEIEEWKDGEEEPDIKLFRPGEMKKYMNSPIRKESKRHRMKEDWDRYDPNVEARFMDIGDSYNDVPEDSEYEEDGLYEYELAIPRRSIKEFAEFVADLFGERLEDIKNNDSEHVWVVSVDKSRDEVIVKCVCTAEEFKEIDKWAWR